MCLCVCLKGESPRSLEEEEGRRIWQASEFCTSSQEKEVTSEEEEGRLSINIFLDNSDVLLPA